jgi:integrase
MAEMGRRRTTHHGLPPHMAQKGRSYYYVANGNPRRWIPLGNDYPVALREWAKVEGEPIPACARTFSQIAAWYRAKVMPDKALRTQKDNEAELANLEAVFGDSPIDTIEPVDVATYRSKRYSKKKLMDGDKPKLAKVRGNREIALLSDIWNFARELGFTTKANPCTGVERNPETGRERYVDDTEFDTLYEKADEILRDALDLLLLTGQRPADVLKMKRTDIRDGCLWVRQGKTRKPLRITDEADLAAALDRMLTRKRTATGAALIQDDAGQPLTYWMLEDRWSKARAAAGLPDVQMRDLRGKAATDLDDLAHAQALLGHTTRAMTEKYVKQRAGDRVAPLRRKAK